MKEEHPILRLAEPKKKGLMSLLFSRLGLILLLVILQIALIVGIYTRFSQYVPYFAVIESVLPTGVVVNARLHHIFLASQFPVYQGIILIRQDVTTLSAEVV